jgi:hypothetical protein
MKNYLLCLAAGVSCLALFGNASPVLASEGVSTTPEERLQRIEQRLNDLADRLPGAALGNQTALAAPGQQSIRPADPLFSVNHPLALKVLQHARGLEQLAFLVWIICNLLLAIWIFTDIRQRGEGSGIFVALALVAGIPAAVIYSLVRIGDKLAAGGK